MWFPILWLRNMKKKNSNEVSRLAMGELLKLQPSVQYLLISNPVFSIFTLGHVTGKHPLCSIMFEEVKWWGRMLVGTYL